MDNVATPEREASVDIPTTYDLGDCIFNAAHGELKSKINDNHLHLEKKVAQVLHCLVKAQGEVVTREVIFDEVWPNIIVSDDSLNRCISVLRKKLRQFEHQVSIKTHPKVGFHLVYCSDHSSINNEAFNLASTQNAVSEATVNTPISPESTLAITESNKPVYLRLSVISLLTILVIFIVFTLWQLSRANSPISNNAIPLSAPTLDHHRVVILPFELSQSIASKYPTLESSFRQLIANHPSLSTISVNEVKSVSHLFSRDIARTFQARFIIRAKGFIEQERDILHWQIIDGQNGDVLFDSLTNLALTSTEITIRTLATQFVEQTLPVVINNNPDAYMQAIIESASYFFISQKGTSYNRPAINMLAKSVTDIAPNSVAGLKTLAKLLSVEVWSMQKLSHPYSNLAMNSLAKAIELAPLDAELYQLLSRLQMAKYQWHEARATLMKAQQVFQQNQAEQSINLYELQHQAGQLSAELLFYYQQQYQQSPLNINIGLFLACLYMQMDKPEEAIDITNSLVLQANDWGETGALLGPAYIRIGDEQKGRSLFFSGYQALGVPESYIDSLYQGIKYPDYQQQASQFLTQAANNGIFERTVLLYMYAELADIENYFKLAFELADSQQYRILSALRAHSKEIRQHPKFITLVEKIGLADYWQQYGLPNFCQQGETLNCAG